MKFLFWLSQFRQKNKAEGHAVEWRKWLRITQIISTVMLVGWLAKSVNWVEFRPLLAMLSWRFIAFSTVCVLGSHLLNIVRWRHLLKPTIIRYSRLTRYYGAGLFANNFLPTGIGGDGIRIALLSRDVIVSQAIFSVGLDRLLGLCGLTVFVLPAFWLGLPPGLHIRDNVIQVFVDWKNVLTVILLISFVIILSLLSLGRYSLKFRALTIRFMKQFQGFDNVSQWDFRRGSSLLIGAYGLSVGSQLLLIAAHWSVLQALGIVLSPGVAIWLVLLVSLSMILPIAVNGLGLQESVYVVVLGYYGVPALSALGVALLIRVLMTFFSLVGGLISLGWKTSIPASHAQA